MAAAELQKRRLITTTVRRLSRGLLDTINALVPTREDAEDILQDVLYRFSANFDNIRSLDRASAWLYRVARNRVTDWYRARSRRPATSVATALPSSAEQGYLLEEYLPDLSHDPERIFVRKEIIAAIEQALENLPPAQRDVFIWHEIDGISFAEIAALTGDPLNTLLSRKRYAIRDLRQQLKELINLTL